MNIVSVSFSKGLLLTLMLASSGFAQAEAPHTIWSFLGIPQGCRKIHGAMFNRHGNHPKLEKKPPLKAIADPANLESPVPAIKKAAEVKMAEDLKKQKIKAVKYLASIGCGCYDIDGSVTAAMLSATEDCTEAVRLATIEAIAEQASGQCCEQCGQVCCCNEAMLKRLAEMAYHRDDKGCYIEPSERVRAAAARALEICCPNQAPVVELGEPSQPLPPVEPEGIETPPPPPEGTEPDLEAEAWSGSSVNPLASLSPPQLAPVASPHGVIIHTDKERRAAHVHFHERHATLPVGAIVVIYTESPQGREIVGRMRVYQAFEGSANVQELDSGTFDRITTGTRVMADPKLVALGNLHY
jgi:hypothetical protein